MYTSSRPSSPPNHVLSIRSFNKIRGWFPAYNQALTYSSWYWPLMCQKIWELYSFCEIQNPLSRSSTFHAFHSCFVKRKNIQTVLPRVENSPANLVYIVPDKLHKILCNFFIKWPSLLMDNNGIRVGKSIVLLAKWIIELHDQRWIRLFLHILF